MLDKIILIHPTKCAGTAISENLYRLRGFSDRNSAFLSGYTFNRLFQNNIQTFYFLFHSKNVILYLVYLLFYFVCLVSSFRNLLSKHKLGLTFSNGSIQHFTYREWRNTNKMKEDSVCIGIVTHPQHRMVSSFYFLGYNKHYNFLEFLYAIQDGSLLSSIQFLGFRAIIKQHIRSMYDTLKGFNDKDCSHFLLKRESLNDDWKEFCSLYNLKNNTLKHINKTKKSSDWKHMYRKYPEASQLVYKLYKKDFEYFGYKMYGK
jgi:hypothetical protein